MQFWLPLHILPASVQSTHCAPLLPHAVSMVPGTHMVPCKHPPQTHCRVTLPEQVSPLAVHESHMAPPLPHELSAVPGLHMLPEQQPSVQDRPLQTHVPLFGSHA